MSRLVERQGNALDYVTDSKPLVHCISADYALGAGIAKQVVKKYNILSDLRSVGTGVYPDCIKTGNIINMVTKKYCWMKPTYETFVGALLKVKDICKENNINHVVMPRIGCGLDRLNWNQCREYIENYLVREGIDVDVYYL